MKDLVEFLMESYEITEAKNSGLKDERAAFKTSFRTKLKKEILHADSDSVSKHPLVIWRANMGKDDDEFVDYLKDKLSGTVTYPESDDPNVPVVKSYPEASGTYRACKVHINGRPDDEYWYITNANGVKKSDDGSIKATIKSKLLTPNALGLISSLNNLKWSENKNEIISTVKSAVEAKLSKKHPAIYEYCMSLIDAIADDSNEIQSSLPKRLDDFAASDEDFSVSVGFLKSAVDAASKIGSDEFTEADRRIVSNDFGEVLSMLIMMRAYPQELGSFPEASNNALTDYSIGSVNISAKSADSSSSGKPSGAAAFNMSYNAYLEAIEDKTADEKYPKLEQLFYRDVCSTYYNSASKKFAAKTAGDEGVELDPIKSNVQRQQCMLIDTFVLNSKNIPEYKASLLKFVNREHLDVLDIIRKLDITRKTYAKIADDADRMISSDLDGFFSKLCALRKRGQLKADEMVRGWNRYSDKEKYGKLIYPLYTLAVKVMNDIFGNADNDIISQILSKLEFKQAYFSTSDNKIKIDVKSPEKHKWEFAYGGIDSKEGHIFNIALAIVMR